VPPAGQSVSNLLSKGIIALDTNKNAIQGPNYQLAQQLQAQDQGDAFLLSPPAQPFANNSMPSPLAGGPKTCGDFSQCLPTVALAQQTETGLSASYYQYLTTGATGLTSKTPDTRITGVTDTTGTSVPSQPFQLTNSTTFPYTSYAASPVHRFYQMWQQLNCSIAGGNPANPPGCNGQLFAWVEVTVGAGANGVAQPSTFSTEWSPTAVTTGEGSTALGFYNVQQGDVPYFMSLVQKYAMSDNFHQSLNDKGISWKYYGDQWNNYVNDPYKINYGTSGPTADEYCNICNPFHRCHPSG
jgi:phospholipase C